MKISWSREESGEWRRGWGVALAATLGSGISVMHIYSTGVFMAPIHKETGWSRAEISGCLSLVGFVSALTGPFVGLLIDRWKPRRVALLGLVIYSAALASLALANASIWSWFAIWGAVAVGSALIKPTVWSAAAVSRFRAARGLALGVILSGNALGAAVFPLAAALFIARFGWRGAYVGLAGAALVIAGGLVFAFFPREPVERRSIKVRAEAGDLPGLAVREALRGRVFWCLVAASILFTTPTSGLIVHLVPLLQDFHIPAGQAVLLASTAGLAAVIGRLISGYVLDRSNPLIVAVAVFLMPTIAASLLLGLAVGTAATICATLVLGLAIGAEVNVMAYLSSRFFGPRNFGVLFGAIAGLLSFCSGLGPLISGAIYDHVGNYRPALWLTLPGCVLGAVAIACLGRRAPVWEPAPLAVEEAAITAAP